MKKPSSLKIIYFGIYSKGIEYPRNNNLIRGLHLNGVSVVQSHFNIVGSFRKRMRVIGNPMEALVFLFKLAVSFVTLAWRFIRAPQANALIVGHPGYFHIHLARILRRLFKKNALLVYDIFIPLYEAIVEDRKLLKPDSLSSRLLHRFEASCCRCADLCLIDTQAHCRYLVETYDLQQKRVHRIFVGATIRDTFDSLPPVSGETFKVLFFGTYIPLHGVDVIIEAARKLENNPDIQFLLVGSGQLRPEMEQLSRQRGLQNIVFQDWVSTERIAELIRSYDLSLGIFGSTAKTQRVIPSKIFDICAAGVPFITADTPAIREVFVHGENAWFVPQKDPSALANAILLLKSDPELREKIAMGAHQLAEDVFSLHRIGESLIHVIQKAVDRTS